MNIFILNKDPAVAARNLCDKHVVKMFLESVQLLCNVSDEAPYRNCHINHPCSKWALESRDNYLWLIKHALAIHREYNLRYGKIHKSLTPLQWVIDNYLTFDLPEIGRTDFVQCMPDKYKVKNNPVQAYRNYYIGDKSYMAKWDKIPSRKPTWWKTYARS